MPEFERNLDRSPFPPPPGWTGGGVEAIGGGGQARVWYSESGDLRVIYELYGPVVQLQAWQELGQHYEVHDSIEARSSSDGDLADAARRLMERHGDEAAGPAHGEFRIGGL